MQRDTLTQEPYRSEVRPQQEEDTIDLLELCMGLLDHWKFIAAAAAAGMVLAALYTFLLVTPSTRPLLPSMWSAATTRC